MLVHYCVRFFLLLQAPLCPGQKLSVGLQRFYSVDTNVSAVDSSVAESKQKLVESLGEDTCMGPVSAKELSMAL